ncbi:MAG: SDR family NAD(P)-dependent oxidoreductase [Acidimicrobiales bacterium]|jgi:NAD(P)-dependent dehydrogenase (short-subunit alcohol dehydrogenase family)
MPDAAAVVQVPIDRWLDLSGRGAIVTGAGSGIGRAISLRLAEAGAAVVVADIDEDGAAATVDRIKSAGWRAVAQPADVRNPEAARAAASRVVDEFGRLDILVNNAGLYPRSPVFETSEEMWDLVVDINLKGTFLFSQACARIMVDIGNGGSIINLASKQALRGSANLAHYAASKAGVIMFTQSLAIELGPENVRVNAIAPGPVATEGGKGAGFAQVAGTSQSVDEVRDAYLKKIPLRRFSDPDDIARVALFLASDAASLMTGTVVVVDGGASLT